MAQRLKRWESPRREGRNDKGRGGSARARQLKKQQQMLRKKLKEQSETENNKNYRGGKINFLPYFFVWGVDLLTYTVRRSLSGSIKSNGDKSR